MTRDGSLPQTSPDGRYALRVVETGDRGSIEVETYLFDCVARRDIVRLGDTVEYAESMYDALRGARALVVLTDWNAYRNPDFGRIKTLLASPVLIDARNLYEPSRLRAMGFTYDDFGRGRRRGAIA